MKNNINIIINKKSNKYIEICYASFYQRNEKTYLISGDGIKTVKSENELNVFITDLFLEYLKPIKIYTIDQIHTKVGVL